MATRWKKLVLLLYSKKVNGHSVANVEKKKDFQFI